MQVQNFTFLLVSEGTHAGVSSYVDLDSISITKCLVF